VVFPNEQGHNLAVNVPLTAELHREGEWFVAFCPEIPEANGQGRTQEECVQSLREAILLLLEDRRDTSLQPGLRRSRGTS
jgi:predicted RNase H-like HicB family nuclease